MKVRVNSWYVYVPTGWDVADPKTALSRGDRVQVRNMHGCPKANTMGHCHVYTETGKFAGLVSTASLITVGV